MKMKKNITRFFVFCLAFLLLASAFSLCAFAETKWEYEEYELPLGFHKAGARIKYLYETEWACYTHDQKSGICMYTNAAEDKVLLNETGKATLEAFYQNPTESGCLVLIENGVVRDLPFTARLPQTDFAALREQITDTNASNPLTVSVRELSDCLVYRILAADPSYTVYTVLAGIYSIEGQFYALFYTDLDNTHFDANGDFSYRSGTVELTLCKADFDKLYGKYQSEAEDRAAAFLQQQTEDKSDGDKQSGSSDGAPLFFYIDSVLFGLILPGVLLGVSLLLALNKKKPHNRRWLIVTGLSAAWIILAILLFIIIVTV